MMFSVLKKPRRLPQRFNRTVTPQTRRLVERRHKNQKQYKWQRWKRLIQQAKRKAVASRRFLLPIIAVLIVLLILLMIGLAVFSPLLNVRQIRVARTDARLDDTLIEEALRPLFGRRMPLVSVQEVPSLLLSALPDANRAAVPDLATVTMTQQYPATLLFHIDLKPITYRITIKSPSQTAAAAASSASGADFLTEDGMYVVYQTAQVPKLSTLPQFTVVDWGVRPEPWKNLVSADFLKAITDTKSELKTQFKADTSATVVYLRAREYHLQTKNYSLWFDLKSPIADQLHRLAMFLKTAPPGAAKQYIDLRVRGKIFYQ